MYDELVNLLRRCGKQKCKNCEYEHVIGCVTKMNEEAADAIEHMQKTIVRLENELGIYDDLPMVYQIEKPEDESVVLSKTEKTTQWIPVTERLPECDLGAEVGNIEWISCGMVLSGCFGRGGKYRDAYFRTWTDAGEGMDAKDADYWRAVTLPEPPKEET